MITVEIEDLMAETILSFCENSAELGCPKDKEVDMWFRELTPEERRDVMDKLLDIEDRDINGKVTRFSVFHKEDINGVWDSIDDYKAEYSKHIDYGASGNYNTIGFEVVKGTISSHLAKCTELNSKGYKNLKFCNGGDDDVLVVDHEMKEYGFFEDYPPTEEQLKSGASLTAIWLNVS